MIVVSDTTPLNYLILIESVHVLPALFGRVYAPSAVIHELAHPRSPEPVRRWTDSLPEWLTVQEPTRIDPSLRLGSGEAAAIALAEELKADWVLVMSARVRGKPSAADFEWPARSASLRKPGPGTFSITSTRAIGSWSKRPSTLQTMCFGSRSGDSETGSSTRS